MKKRIIVTAAITVCIAPCAAVWPQPETVKETPVPTSTPVVTAPGATVVELKTEVVLESVPTERPAAPEVQPTPESAPVPEVSYGPATEQAVEPPVAPTTIEPLSGDMVYVEGFGWIESQGLNHVEYAEDMYENGNKIGIMG